MPLIDLESTVSIKELLSDSKNGELDLDPRAYWQRYALNTSLTLNYGWRIEGDKEDGLLKEITEVERGVSNLRSTSHNWGDYVPLLRWWGGSGEEARVFRERRDVYMDRLLRELKERVSAGTDRACISGNIIKDPEAGLNEGMCPSSAVPILLLWNLFAGRPPSLCLDADTLQRSSNP